MRLVPPRLASSILVVAGLASSSAHVNGADSPTKQQCLETHVRTQLLRQKGELVKARRAARECADPGCPTLIRNDCTEAAAALAAAIATTLVGARERDGSEVAGLEIRIDGRLVTASEIGHPIELDPGEHVFAFAAEDGRAVERRVTLSPGGLSVPVIVDFEPPHTETTAKPKAEIPIETWIFGGIAGVGLAAFVGFGLAGKSTERCKGQCTDEQIDRLHRQYLYADIGLVTALAAGAGAAYFYFSRNARKRTERAWVGVGPSRGGASLALGTSF